MHVIVYPKRNIDFGNASEELHIIQTNDLKEALELYREIAENYKEVPLFISTSASAPSVVTGLPTFVDCRYGIDYETIVAYAKKLKAIEAVARKRLENKEALDLTIDALREKRPQYLSDIPNDLRGIVAEYEASEPLQNAYLAFIGVKRSTMEGYIKTLAQAAEKRMDIINNDLERGIVAAQSRMVAQQRGMRR